MSTGRPADPLIRPVDLAVRTVSLRRRARRAARIATVATRRLAPVPVRWGIGRRRTPLPVLLGPPLRDAAFELGVTFVKVAQLLASSPSLVGEGLANSLRGVLDGGPAIPEQQLRATIERSLGRPVSQVFAGIEPRPMAAASLAVVHRATLLDGTPVAVKVLRPEARGSVRVDLSMLQPLAHWLARQLPVAGVSSLPDAVDGLAEQLSEELDLRNEARVMAWFAEVLALIGLEGVRVPAVFPEASGQDVLTMELVDGSAIDDLDALAANGVDAAGSIRSLIEAWFAVALCTGTFHGDMHAGNLLLTKQGEVVLLDWGIVGRLPAASRRFFRRSLEGAMGDESAWPDVRDHMLTSFGTDALDQIGITEDQFLQLVKAQTMLIMTLPFSQLDLRALFGSATMVEHDITPTPRSAKEWLSVLREQRRLVRAGGTGSDKPTQARGEFLLIKQLVFFERYGKLFLGDEPLIFDTEVYKALLALPAFADPVADPEAA